MAGGRTGALPPTPSHTVGPFFGHALPFTGGGEPAPADRPDAITVHGRVLDGEGSPVPDALIETWQADPGGGLGGRPGSLRRDQASGGCLGRTGADFTGFARTATDAGGCWCVRTLPPGRTGGADAPFLSVCVFARGLLHHLFTRIYLPEHAAEAAGGAGDPLLASLPPARRRTLVATVGPHRRYHFDIRLQGEEETVFLDFR